MPELAPTRQHNFMFWARLPLASSEVITEGTPVASQPPPKNGLWNEERRDLEISAGSAGLQNAGLNILRATWNPLKQWGLPMRSYASRIPRKPAAPTDSPDEAKRKAGRFGVARTGKTRFSSPESRTTSLCAIVLLVIVTPGLGPAAHGDDSRNAPSSPG